MAAAESGPVEQYLLFDHTAYLKGVENIGTIALSEIIIYEEPHELPELLQLHAGEDDNLPRLFEV